MQPIKTVALDTKNTARYYDFLEDHMKEKAIELIRAIPEASIKNDIDLGYSLGNCQGDGVCFKKGSIVLATPEVNPTNPSVIKFIETLKKTANTEQVKDLSLSIEFAHNSPYTHEKSFGIDVYFDCLIKNEDGEDERISETSCDIYAPKFFIDQFISICKELEKYGYDLIEDEDREEMCREALIRFCEINNFDDEAFIEEYEYTTEEKQITDEMIQVATKGDSQFDGLWVALPKFEERTRDEHYRAFID